MKKFLHFANIFVICNLLLMSMKLLWGCSSVGREAKNNLKMLFLVEAAKFS